MAVTAATTATANDPQEVVTVDTSGAAGTVTPLCGEWELTPRAVRLYCKDKEGDECEISGSEGDIGGVGRGGGGRGGGGSRTSAKVEIRNGGRDVWAMEVEASPAIRGMIIASPAYGVVQVRIRPSSFLTP